MIAKRLSRSELITVVDRILNGRFSDEQEENFLLDEFERNAMYPYAADLITFYRNEFKSAEELVDFALNRIKVPKLTREQLIEVARKLMTADIANDIES